MPFNHDLFLSFSDPLYEIKCICCQNRLAPQEEVEILFYSLFLLMASKNEVLAGIWLKTHFKLQAAIFGATFNSFLSFSVQHLLS